jgi:hypothetical protein
VADRRQPFDPLGMLSALDRHRVSYVVIGAFARVVHGADEVTRGIDVVPSLRPENLRRLQLALRDLNARRADGRDLDVEQAAQAELLIELKTPRGELKVVPEPEGTRGYDDLRRHATREPLGAGVRPSVASLGDLSRMLAALGREDDQGRLRALHRLAELDRQVGLEL